MTATEPSESFQIPIEAAELYEAAFVPGFFAQWAPLLCDAADVGPGQEVLDVACGTGIVARTAAGRVAPAGRVVGVDLNEAMLTVARRVAPDLDWREGDAAALPVPGRAPSTGCSARWRSCSSRTGPARCGRWAASPGPAAPSRCWSRAASMQQPAFRPTLEMMAAPRRTRGPLAAQHVLRVRRH